MRRFRYDARHALLNCPPGEILEPGRRSKHGRFFTARAKECRRGALKALRLSEGRVNEAGVLGDASPALLRARRRRERWGEEEIWIYRRHRWRSEGLHGAAKTWHGLARAVRRGLDDLRIQSFLTAAAIKLKRLAAAPSALTSALFALQDQPARS